MNNFRTLRSWVAISLVLFSGLTLFSCTESDGIFLIDDGERPSMENKRITDYPDVLDSLIHAKVSDEIDEPFIILNKIIHHPAVLQTEPSRKEYIDCTHYMFQFQTKTLKSKEINHWIINFKQNGQKEFRSLGPITRLGHP